MLIVLKRRRHLLELAGALDEYLLVCVDQNVADRLVAEQRLERSEAEDLVDDVAENRIALRDRQRHAASAIERETSTRISASTLLALGGRELLEIQLRQQLAVHAAAHFQVLCPARTAGPGPA